MLVSIWIILSVVAFLTFIAGMLLRNTKIILWVSTLLFMVLAVSSFSLQNQYCGVLSNTTIYNSVFSGAFWSVAGGWMFPNITAGGDDDIRITGHLNQTTGNATINLLHGEMWNYTNGITGWRFSIPTAGIYYNLTNMTAGELNGFAFTSNSQTTGGSYLTASVGGLYQLNSHVSFKSENVGGLFGFSIAQNWDETEHRECYSRRQAVEEVGSVATTCHMLIDAGDNVSIMIENENNDRDVFIQTANLNLVRIGDAPPKQ